MNIAAITPQQEVRKFSSNDLKQKVMDYRKDNEYLAKMTAYNENKAQLIREGIAAERIR
jgi:hypothetical protein